jgi:methylase of polypeptide subunit release factors
VVLVKNICDFDFDKIPIDNFWNIGEVKESKMHRIHSYPAKFPAFITTKAIEYSRNNQMNINKIADIFCGCGTVALEAKKQNIAFWGVDINPVATMIAKTKSWNYNINKLHSYYDSILYSFYENKNDYYNYVSAPKRIKYWYNKKNYCELSKLKSSIFINTPYNSKYRYFFICAFSNILKNTSAWLTKSIKPQLDSNKLPSDVIDSFICQFQFMQRAAVESNIKGNSEVEIRTENILDKSFNKPKVDLIISSPPYVTSYEYADLHQLSTLWLEYKEDYRDLRYGSIGSLYHVTIIEENINKLNKTGKTIINELINKGSKKTKSIAKYFIDMQEVAKVCRKMLNKNGAVVFVVGNTEYGGVRIDNVKHLCESLNEAGFEEIKVSKRRISGKILTPYRDDKGRFSTNHKNRKVYAEEFIIIGK